MVPDEHRSAYPRAEIRWPVASESSRVNIEAKLRNLGIGGAWEVSIDGHREIHRLL